MTHEQALNKAVRCLKLSKSSNPNEAALAAAKAQEIIDRYNLAIDDINQGIDPKTTPNDEPIQDFGSDNPLHEVCQVDTLWTLRLAHIVAEQNSCRTYWHAKMSGSAMVKIIGRPSDVQATRYIFGWLESEVRRLTKQECKGMPRRYVVDFRTGVVDTIYRKLSEQRKQTYQEVQQEANNPFVLVRIQHSIARVEQKGLDVDAWMKQNLKLRQPKFRKKADISARAHGQQAGEQIRFTKAKGAIGDDSV